MALYESIFEKNPKQQYLLWFSWIPECFYVPLCSSHGISFYLRLLHVFLLYLLHSYFVSSLTPLQVDFVSYMDELAGEIGVRPSLLWLLFTDYPLFKKVLWGPVSAYQYRLMGPGKWDGARRAIFTQFDRMYQPLKTRQVWNELCETCTEC